MKHFLVSGSLPSRAPGWGSEGWTVLLEPPGAHCQLESGCSQKPPKQATALGFSRVSLWVNSKPQRREYLTVQIHVNGDQRTGWGALGLTCYRSASEMAYQSRPIAHPVWRPYPHRGASGDFTPPPCSHAIASRMMVLNKGMVPHDAACSAPVGATPMKALLWQTHTGHWSPGLSPPISWAGYEGLLSTSGGRVTHILLGATGPLVGYVCLLLPWFF